MTDVNTAFAEQRAGDIAEAYAARDRAEAYNERSLERYARDVAAFDQRVRDGKLISLGGGRFRVNDPGSWDNNETLYLSQPTPQSAMLILPEVGLDTFGGGRSKLYTAEPSWHATEGTGLIPGGTTDIEKVLELGGINFPVLQAPASFSGLLDTSGYGNRCEICHAPIRLDGESWLNEDGLACADGDEHVPSVYLRGVPDTFINYRGDTGDALGAVGKVYEPVQNRDAMAFLAELVGKDAVIYESAGSIRGGRKVFVCIRLPEDIVVDAEGINDVIRPFILIVNTHDGSGLLKAVVTPWRPVCANTERFAVRDAHTSWGVRHTRNALDRVAEARRNLGLMADFFERYAEEENQLARIGLELDQFQSLIGSLWVPDGDTSKRADTTFAKRTDALNAMFERQKELTGQTAFTAERVVTDYLDNVAPKRALAGPKGMAAARATAIIEGTDDRVKTRAHQKLMRLVA